MNLNDIKPGNVLILANSIECVVIKEASTLKILMLPEYEILFDDVTNSYCYDLTSMVSSEWDIVKIFENVEEKKEYQMIEIQRTLLDINLLSLMRLARIEYVTRNKDGVLCLWYNLQNAKLKKKDNRWCAENLYANLECCITIADEEILKFVSWKNQKPWTLSELIGGFTYEKK